MACHRGYRSWEHLCVTKMKHSLTIWFCRDELSFAMLLIALISMLEVLLFLCQYELLSWIFRIWIFISQVRRITLKLCQLAFDIKNYLFYHLPTRGRAGIKLRDAWYVSNVSIIFDFSMLYYLLFWAILGFNFHFYIIFGINLLTRGPAQICCFMPISVFRGKGISDGVKTERNQLENLFLEGKQRDRLGPYVRRWRRSSRG